MHHTPCFVQEASGPRAEHENLLLTVVKVFTSGMVETHDARLWFGNVLKGANKSTTSDHVCHYKAIHQVVAWCHWNQMKTGADVGPTVFPVRNSIK